MLFVRMRKQEEESRVNAFNLLSAGLEEKRLCLHGVHLCCSSSASFDASIQPENPCTAFFTLCLLGVAFRCVSIRRRIFRANSVGRFFLPSVDIVHIPKASTIFAIINESALRFPSYSSSRHAAE